MVFGFFSDTKIIECKNCYANLRLPKGKKGYVNCPKCGHRFYANTSSDALSANQKEAFVKDLHNYSVGYDNACIDNDSSKKSKYDDKALDRSLFNVLNKKIIEQHNLDKSKLKSMMLKIFWMDWPEDILVTNLMITVFTNLKGKTEKNNFFIPYATICFPQTLKYIAENENTLFLEDNQIGPIALYNWFSNFDGDFESAPDVSI